MDDETRARPIPDDMLIAFNLSVFAVPVIPGPAEIRHPEGPGHLERLMISTPHGAWPLADRWRDLSR